MSLICLNFFKKLVVKNVKTNCVSLIRNANAKFLSSFPNWSVSNKKAHRTCLELFQSLVIIHLNKKQEEIEYEC